MATLSSLAVSWHDGVMALRLSLVVVVFLAVLSCAKPDASATSSSTTPSSSTSTPSTPSTPSSSTPPSSALSPTPGHTEGALGPRWRHDDVDGALAAAAAAGRLVFVDAWAPWCHTCLSMQRDVLERPELGALRDVVEFVAVDTDREQNAGFVARFPMNLWPTFFVLDPARPDGPPLAVHPGSATLEELVALVKSARAAQHAPDDTTQALQRALAAAHAAGSDVVALTAAWDAALAVVPPGHPRRPEVVRRAAWARVRGDPLSCVRFIEAHRGEAQTGSAPGDLESALLSCADRLAGDDATPSADDAAARSEQQAIRQRARPRLQALVNTPPTGAAVDDRADTMATLAELEETLGDHAAAVSVHEARLKLLEADAARATTERGAQVHDYARLNSLLFLQRGDEAVALLRARAKALPTDYEPVARLASALHRLKRPDEAKVAAEQAIGLSYGPRRLRYRLLLADIEIARGDLTGARAALDRLIAEEATLPAALRAPGLVDEAQAKRQTLPPP